MPVSVVRDPRYARHEPGPRHPESPARLASIDRALAGSRLRLVERPSRPATEAELLRVHTAGHLARIAETRGRSAILDEDTRTSPDSYDAALFAAGAVIDLARDVVRGACPPGIALVRPPGHHATRDTPMGFCLFNNVAAAAAALIAEGLCERVAIYDFDFHHGNGTEAIFYAEPRVFYASTHQWPAYPGTGEAHRVGVGPGEGANLDMPLDPGSGDRELFAAIDGELAPALRRFRPDALLLSAGFDALVDDPLGGLRVSLEGFGQIGARTLALADELCEGRVMAALEGGYAIDRLGDAVVRFLEAWDR